MRHRRLIVLGLAGAAMSAAVLAVTATAQPLAQRAGSLTVRRVERAFKRSGIVLDSMGTYSTEGSPIPGARTTLGDDYFKSKAVAGDPDAFFVEVYSSAPKALAATHPSGGLLFASQTRAVLVHNVMVIGTGKEDPRTARALKRLQAAGPLIRVHAAPVRASVATFARPWWSHHGPILTIHQSGRGTERLCVAYGPCYRFGFRIARVTGTSARGTARIKITWSHTEVRPPAPAPGDFETLRLRDGQLMEGRGRVCALVVDRCGL
jgi:hypothetical protein